MRRMAGGCAVRPFSLWTRLRGVSGPRRPLFPYAWAFRHAPGSATARGDVRDRCDAQDGSAVVHGLQPPTLRRAVEYMETDAMTLFSFNARVQVAIDRIRAVAPDAQLLEAEGRASSGLIEHPSAIDRLRVLFRRGVGTLVVEETGYGEFGAPLALDLPWSGEPLEWPVEMDLHEADSLKEGECFFDPYASVTLRMLPNGNPGFVFGGNGQCGDVVVDTISGSVRGG